MNRSNAIKLGKISYLVTGSITVRVLTKMQSELPFHVCSMLSIQYLPEI